MANVSNGEGRLGNHVFRNLVMSLIAEKNNIKMTYSSFNNKIKELGIPIFETGTMTYSTTIDATLENAVTLMAGPPIFQNITPAGNYFQTHEIATYLCNYLCSAPISDNIKQHNHYKERYGNNNDVFIHVRLGDVTGRFSQPLSYFENALSKISFDRGYVSSDSPEHPICRELCSKYGLTILSEEEVRTVMFGSTCKHVILSHGTFSWTIGALSFDSDIYVPDFKATWHGDIFDMPGWQQVSR